MLDPQAASACSSEPSQRPVSDDQGVSRVRSTLLLLAVPLVLAVLAGRADAQVPTFLYQWGSTGIGSGEFDGPYGIAVSSNGTVYVADKGNRRIQLFSSQGAYLSQWENLG